MHQTSCQPSAEEAIFLLMFVFPSASSITQNLFTDFTGFLHILILLFIFVFIYFVLFWGLFHHWFDLVKVFQRPILKN